MTDSEYVRYASLEVHPAEPVPSKIVVRNTEGFAGLVLNETDAWELYALLDEHFGGNRATEQGKQG